MQAFEGRWPSGSDMGLAFVAFVVAGLVDLQAPVITSTTWYYYILLLFAGMGVAAAIATLRAVASSVIARIHFCVLHFLVKRVATTVAQGEYDKAKHEGVRLFFVDCYLAHS